MFTVRSYIKNSGSHSSTTKVSSRLEQFWNLGSVLHHFQPLLRLLVCLWIKLILLLYLFITLFFNFFLLLFLFYFMSVSFFFFFSALSLFLPPVPIFIPFSFPVPLQNTFPFPDLLHVYIPLLIWLNPRSLEGEGGLNWPPPLQFFGFTFFSLTNSQKFCTTVPCLLTNLLTLIKWHHKWWCRRKESHKLHVDSQISDFG